jgi:hypothetical protein
MMKLANEIEQLASVGEFGLGCLLVMAVAALMALLINRS